MDSVTCVLLLAILSAEVSITLSSNSEWGRLKMDLVFLLDSSASIGDNNFQKLKNFCKEFLRKVDLDHGNVRVGILSFSSNVRIEFYLNSHNTSQQIVAAIDTISYMSGNANTADGLKTMRIDLFSHAHGDRSDAPNVCIILTDGVSNVNPRRTIPEAEEARAADIHIFGVGIGLTDTKELNDTVSQPVTENAIFVKTFDELTGLQLSDKVFQSISSGSSTTTTVTENKNSSNIRQSAESSSSVEGLGTTGLVVLLVSVIAVFAVLVVIAFILIRKNKKKQLAIRANRASYDNKAYENIENEPMWKKSSEQRASQKSMTNPPLKPIRKSSSKKSQQICYENIEIGTRNSEKQKSLPRDINKSVTLVVPNLDTKSKTMGSSIPFIDASKENLDNISQDGNTKSDIVENSKSGKAENSKSGRMENSKSGIVENSKTEIEEKPKT